MTKTKAIFWDNDGTLVNTIELFYEACSEIIAQMGYELTLDEFIHEHLAKNSPTFAPLLRAGFNDKQINEFLVVRDELYTKKLKEGVEILPHILNTLNTLHGKIFMGIVTSSSAEHFDIIMEHTNLSKYFEFFIRADDVQNIKPDPEPYLMAIEQSGFKPSECVCIEDTPKGIVAGKKAGISAFAIPTDYTKVCDFSAADEILKDASEILKYL